MMIYTTQKVEFLPDTDHPDDTERHLPHLANEETLLRPKVCPTQHGELAHTQVGAVLLKAYPMR